MPSGVKCIPRFNVDPKLEKLRNGLRAEMGKLDLQVSTITSLIQLQYQDKNPKTEEPDKYNLIRDAWGGSRLLQPKELKGRRIVALTWSPFGGLGELQNLSFLNFEKVVGDDSSIKVSTGLMPTAPGTSFEISLAVFHVPQ